MFPALHPRHCVKLLTMVALAMVALSSLRAHAQDKGQPGHFDFYLMNVAWGPEFCTVPGAGAHCTPPHGFVLHGLWTQNNNGTYPVFCSNEPGPADLANNLDITPDLPLLQHEWDKHGTCAAVGPQRFFRMEHEAFRSFHIPARLQTVDRELSLPTLDILLAFYKANPEFPMGSILLSCTRSHLTAVEACFSKDLQPMRCQSLPTCMEPILAIQPSAPGPKS